MQVRTSRAWWCAGFLLISLSSRARADGFTLERYEPTPAGAWFFSVAHPWYSSTRYLAAGLTLDYGHNTLLGGTFDKNGFHKQAAIVEHDLIGHIDVAGSFLDRVQLSVSLPITLLERGTAMFGVAPLSGVSVGDPRIGFMIRLWGQPDRDPISIHFGGYAWIPVGVSGNHAGDVNARGLPEVILSGLALSHLRWVFDGGVLIRAKQSLGIGPGSATGTELQLGAALAYADNVRRFQVGPELQLGTVLVDGHAFQRFYTRLDLLVGAQYNIAKQVQVGAAIGSGLFGALGEPDVRAIVRVVYAPIREVKPADSDGDGVGDTEDACPREWGIRTNRPQTNGCPDRDGDGIVDSEDRCPDQPFGQHPDAHNEGCPIRDRDGDGIRDAEDLCPNESPGGHPDAKHPGCPIKDADGDGVPDAEDLCPNESSGEHADAKRPGCPMVDSDGDGISDDVDACPKQPGIADNDPTKNGCPKVNDLSIHFALGAVVLLPQSSPVLDDIARILKARGDLEKVTIEGHADETGTAAGNLRLSRRRARAVLEYLVKHGVPRGQLDDVGYGDTRPLSPDHDDRAHALNRRVEVRIDSANGPSTGPKR